MAQVDRAQLKAEYDKCREYCENLRGQIEKLRAEESPPPLQRVANAERTDPPKTNFKCRRTLKGHYGKIYAMHWGPRSESLVSASQDGKLMVWNAQTTNKKLAIALRSSWVMTCAYAPSGKYVACGGLDNLCSIYQVNEESIGWETKQAFRELQQHEGYLSCCRFIDDNEVVTSSGDGQCILWDVETKTPKMTFMDHQGDVMSVSVHKPRNVFVSGSCDATAKVWDYRESEKCVGNFTGHQSDINSVQWFPDGYAFGTGSDDSTIRLFDHRAYRQLNVYRAEPVLCGITSLAFSKSGKYLFAGYDDEPYALVWDVICGRTNQVFTGNTNRVSCLGVPQSGYCLCTGSWDFMLKVWA